MKKLTTISITILLVCVIISSCKKTSSSSSTLSTDSTNNSPFIGVWTSTHDVTNQFDFYDNWYQRRDTAYTTNSNTFTFTSLDSCLIPIDTIGNGTYVTSHNPYKVLGSSQIIIDFNPTASENYINDIYLVDTFNYKISGTTLSLWYNRIALYVGNSNNTLFNPVSEQSVSTGLNASYPGYSSFYGTSPTISYYEFQSDTLTLIKQ